MARYRLVDQCSMRSLYVDLDPDQPAGEAVETLIRFLDLPRTTTQGQPISYAAYHQGRCLPEDQALSAARLPQGATLAVASVQRSIMPEPGTWVEAKSLPGADDLRSFELSAEDLAVKESRPVDYSHLRGASQEVMKAEFTQLCSWYTWYHRIELPYGLVTPSVHHPEHVLERMGVPDQVRGKSVLDIGAWDGGYSFWCERYGASRVVALDVDHPLEFDLSHGYARAGWARSYLAAKRRGQEAQWRFLNQQRFGFEFARACLDSPVARIHSNVYQVSPAHTGCFDVTLFLGVIYHLLNPLQALEAVLSVTKERTYLESDASLDEGLGPIGTAFYQGLYMRDSTNWFIPTPSCLIDMILAVGYRKVRFIGLEKTRVYLEALV